MADQDEPRNQKIPVRRRTSPSKIPSQSTPSGEITGSDLANRASQTERNESAYIRRLVDGAKIQVLQADPGTQETETTAQEELQSSSQSQPRQPGLAQQAKDQVRNQISDKVKDKVKDRVKGEAVKQLEKKAAAKGAQVLLQRASILLGPEAQAAVIALFNGKKILKWGATLTSLGAIGFVLILFVIAAALSSPAAAGTTPTVPFNAQSSADISALKTALAGGINGAKQAQAILAETAKIRSQGNLSAAALALLDNIDQAANIIIQTDPSDTTAIAQQADIIKKKVEQLAQLVSQTAGSCRGITPCLDVDPIAEVVKSHCGRVSALAVLAYVNKGQGDTYFKLDDFVFTRGNIVLDKATADSCLSAATINKLSPPDRRGWVTITWQNAKGGGSSDEQKDRLLQAVVRSLNGNDPVIMYFYPDGVIQNSQHIVPVVGYDQNDEPDKGGTFLINNPNIGHMSGVQTKTGIPSSIKFTGEHIKRYIDGPGGPNGHSVVIREKYLQ